MDELEDMEKKQNSELRQEILFFLPGVFVVSWTLLHFGTEPKSILLLVGGGFQLIYSFLSFSIYFDIKSFIGNAKNNIELMKVQRTFLEKQLKFEQMRLSQLQEQSDQLEVDVSVKRGKDIYNKPKLRLLLECIRKLNDDMDISRQINLNELYSEYSHLVFKEEFDEIVEAYQLVRRKEKRDL